MQEAYLEVEKLCLGTTRSQVLKAEREALRLLELARGDASRIHEAVELGAREIKQEALQCLKDAEARLESVVSAEEDLAKLSKLLAAEKQALAEDKGTFVASQLNWSAVEAVLESKLRLEEEIAALQADLELAEKARLEEVGLGHQL